jgi:YD repeat-containing protein
LGRIEWIIDLNHRTRTFSYDINDNLLTEAWGGTTEFSYTYDKVGNLKPSYDATSLTANSYNYDAIYQLTDATTGNTNLHYEYDVYGDLVRRQDSIDNIEIATIDYTYDRIHQLKQISQSGSNVIGQIIDFDYDIATAKAVRTLISKHAPSHRADNQNL